MITWCCSSMRDNEKLTEYLSAFRNHRVMRKSAPEAVFRRKKLWDSRDVISVADPIRKVTERKCSYETDKGSNR